MRYWYDSSNVQEHTTCKIVVLHKFCQKTYIAPSVYANIYTLHLISANAVLVWQLQSIKAHYVCKKSLIFQGEKSGINDL